MTVDQTQSSDRIPGFAKKFVGDEIQIVQDERWSNPQQATLELAIPGKPGHLKGGITLASNGSGTVETVTGEVNQLARPLAAAGAVVRLTDGLAGSTGSPGSLTTTSS